jgi:hypothetical protein
MERVEDTCEVCITGETCNKNSNRIHCNLHDRSFDKDAWCEQFKKDTEKDKK